MWDLRRRVIGGILACSVTACQSVIADPDPGLAQAETTPPNVIIILTDDMGYLDVGFNGGTEIPTPNIDRIAKEGVRFTRGYVSHPTCGPSRAGLLTGRYQARFGFYQNPNNDPRDPNAGIPLSETLIPDLIAPVGYRSIAIGKWHMGTHPSLRPLERGFDEFFGFLLGSHHYFADEFIKTNVVTAQRPRELQRAWLRRGDTPVETSGYITDLFSDEAVRFIEDNNDDPFFIYLAYNAPHSPLEATEEYLSRFAHIEDETRRTYAAMVSAVDDGVGDVLNALDAQGLAEDTLVVFLSDNGGIVRDRDHPDYAGAPKRSDWNGSDNGPLRAGKGTMFEGGIRVPFAMRWPSRLQNGQTYDRPVISLDIVATMMAANGLDLSGLDGVDLLPHLTGETSSSPHERLFWRQVVVPGRRRFSTIKGDEKYYADERSDLVALYDVDKDISETTDTGASRPADIAEGRASIAAWLEGMPEDHVTTPSSQPWSKLQE